MRLRLTRTKHPPTQLTARHIPRRLDLDEDERLIPILEHLSMALLVGLGSASASNGAFSLFGEGEDGAQARITWDMINGLVKRHAPMCMRNLQETLNEKHHLKHYARLQYNLFLKELGLPIEEALIFWRRSFSLITDDKFQKEYKYNVQHNYGLVGARKNYPAHSCAKILTQNQPGTQDIHGCPFRHMSPAKLGEALWKYYGVGAGDAGDIMKSVKGGHYHLGCTRLFELTHRSKARGALKKGDGIGPGQETVEHPNRYFERSYVLEKQAQEQGVQEDEERYDEPGWRGDLVLSAAGEALAAVGEAEGRTKTEEEDGEGAKKEEEEELAAPISTQSEFGAEFDDDLMDMDEELLHKIESEAAARNSSPPRPQQAVSSSAPAEAKADQVPAATTAEERASTPRAEEQEPPESEGPAAPSSPSPAGRSAEAPVAPADEMAEDEPAAASAATPTAEASAAAEPEPEAAPAPAAAPAEQPTPAAATETVAETPAEEDEL